MREVGSLAPSPEAPHLTGQKAWSREGLRKMKVRVSQELAPLRGRGGRGRGWDAASRGMCLSDPASLLVSVVVGGTDVYNKNKQNKWAKPRAAYAQTSDEAQKGEKKKKGGKE